MELACNLEFYSLAQFLIPYVIAYSETDYPESKRFRTKTLLCLGVRNSSMTLPRTSNSRSFTRLQLSLTTTVE